MELICVDSSFSAQQLEFWKLHGVVHPKRDELFSVREVIRHSNSEVGIRLNELSNPKIPVKHSILGVVQLEPSWKLSRFRTLSGDKVTKEEIEEIIKQTQRV